MNTRISDAALPVVARYVGRTSNIYRYIAEDLAVVDAQIADEARKPEAVRLRDELRERASQNDTNTRDPVAFARLAIDYSQNFATAKPDIGATEKEHILGLCSLVERLIAAHQPVGAMSAEASGIARGMVLHCIEQRLCMGMDEGFASFDPDVEHPFVHELREFADGIRQPVGQEPVDWANVANEYADAACNALDGMKCIRDGLMTADQVIAGHQANIERIQKIHHRDAAPPGGEA